VEILVSYGASVREIRLLTSFYGETSSQIMVNGLKTGQNTRLCGFFQGCLLAPFAWNVYFNNLAERVELLVHGVAHIARIVVVPLLIHFADDILWLAQSILDKEKEWCNEHNMWGSIKKMATCGVDEIQWPDKELDNHAQILPSPSTYPYMGIPLGQKRIDFMLHFRNWLKKANFVLGHIEQLRVHWPHSTQVAAIRTFVQPLLLYGVKLIDHVINDNPEPSTTTRGSEKPYYNYGNRFTIDNCIGFSNWHRPARKLCWKQW
jgi:hypothetical protein